MCVCGVWKVHEKTQSELSCKYHRIRKELLGGGLLVVVVVGGVMMVVDGQTKMIEFK